jgi:hypothetical protein
MRSTRLPLAIAVALPLVWSSSSAHADGAVMIVGTVTPHDRDVIIESVQVAGSALSWKFTAPDFSRDIVNASVGCLNDKSPWSCLSAAVHGSEQLVIVEVDSQHVTDAPMTILTAHVLASGAESEATASRYCELCFDDALKRAVGELSRTLLQEAAEHTRRTKLVIHSRPERAWIMLDGKPVGSTDMIWATYPGQHSIAMLLPGYRAAVRDFAVVEGETLDVSITLEPDLTAMAGPRDRPALLPRASQVLPGLAIGVGGAIAVAGGLLIVFDQDPDPRDTASRYYYDTTKLGIASLGTGLIVAGVGLYFVLRPHATNAATVTALSGGGAVGWAGRF